MTQLTAARWFDMSSWVLIKESKNSVIKILMRFWVIKILMRLWDWSWNAHKLFLGDTIVTQLCRQVIWYEFVTRDEVIKFWWKCVTHYEVCANFFEVIPLWRSSAARWFDMSSWLVMKSSKFWWQCVNHYKVRTIFLEGGVILTQLCWEVIWYEFVLDDEVIEIHTRVCDSLWSAHEFFSLLELRSCVMIASLKKRELLTRIHMSEFIWVIDSIIS